MKNTSLVLKRVCAYMIDIMIVMILSTYIAMIPFLQKDTKKYQNKYSEYEEKYNDLKEIYDLLEASYEDNKINEEEYNKLIETKMYNDIITNSYEDKKISKGEYKEIQNKLIEDNTKLADEYNYILGKIAISDTIITLIVTILYFGILQYFLKGQTIGKKILKIKVVSSSNKKLNILNYILRTLIVNNVLINTIGVILLAYLKKSLYLNIDSILSTLASVIEAIIIFLVLTREDCRGLHDLLFNTKVISTDKKIKIDNNSIKDKEKIIEAEYKNKEEIEEKQDNKEEKVKKENSKTKKSNNTKNKTRKN